MCVSIQGGAGVLAGYPLDTVKVKIQTQDVRNGQTLYRGTFDCLFKLVRKDGVGGHLANVSLLPRCCCEGAQPVQGHELAPARGRGHQRHHLRRVRQRAAAAAAPGLRGLHHAGRGGGRPHTGQQRFLPQLHLDICL